jgi:hypothetical protein
VAIDPRIVSTHEHQEGWPATCIPYAMTLKSATFFALICMGLLSVLLLFGFARDLSGVLRGLVPALHLVESMIYLLASLGLTIFLYVFHRNQ